VYGIDRDHEARESARARLADAEQAGRFVAVAGNYADVEMLAPLAGKMFDGILLDLGVSSRQLDADARGFTFRAGAPLDARMDSASTGRTAADLLNHSDVADLAQMLHEYGDEPKARRLAAEIVRRRQTRPFVTSDDFVGAIRASLGARSDAGDFARLFQAIRIAVNDELAGLALALPALRDRLTAGGVLVVIAYHSGEDRLVKQAFRTWSTACTCPPLQPLCTCGGVAAGTTVTRKAIVAQPAEASANPRARSARLRVWRRTL
jgi:16S rRNA (cytosine1402-N4)-methyltransferase